MGARRCLLYSEFLVLKASEFSLEMPVLINMRTRIAESFSRKGHPNRPETKVAYP